jgi:hypothetical protein
MRPASTEEIAKITAIGPRQPGPVVAHLSRIHGRGSISISMSPGTGAPWRIRWRHWGRKGNFSGWTSGWRRCQARRGNTYARVRCR